MIRDVKIGIMGGSFNPIHNGHVELANYLVNNKIVDFVHIMPSIQNPFKTNNADNVDVAHRYWMARLGLNGHVPCMLGSIRVLASNYEMKTFSWNEAVYAVDLLKSYLYSNIMDHSTDNPLYYIIGADTFNILNKFKDYEWITSSGFIKIVVLERPGVELNKDAVDTSNCIFISGAPSLDISSTKIRKLIYNGEYEEAKKLAPEATINYAIEHKLYE